MLDLLKNEIIINWIAPIITGLVVVAIPAGIIKFFKFRKDEKAITQTNQRFIDSIMPFIIQKIELKASYISDTRSVIVDESGLRDKYVYSEVELRNKLIVDVCESKYIDESRKKELIDFTYECFKSFDKKEIQESSELNEIKKNGEPKPVRILRILFISFFLSQVFLIIILLLYKGDVKPEDNILFLLPILQGLISIIGIASIVFLRMFDSGIFRRNARTRNYLFHNTIFEGKSDKDFLIKYYRYIMEKNNVKKDDKNKKK